jgi:hypothetical protein
LVPYYPRCGCANVANTKIGRCVYLCLFIQQSTPYYEIQIKKIGDKLIKWSGRRNLYDVIYGIILGNRI